MKSKQHLQLGVKSSPTIAIKKREEHILNGSTEIFDMSNVLRVEQETDSIVKTVFILMYICSKLTYGMSHTVCSLTLEGSIWKTFKIEIILISIALNPSTFHTESHLSTFFILNVNKIVIQYLVNFGKKSTFIDVYEYKTSQKMLMVNEL